VTIARDEPPEAAHVSQQEQAPIGSALVLLGFAGAFRRSELIGSDITDLDFGRDGLTVLLRRSKTDQACAGRKVGIPYGSNPDTCPVRSLRAWIEASAIDAGPVFRSINRHGKVQPGRLSGIDVARIVRTLSLQGHFSTSFATGLLRAEDAAFFAGVIVVMLFITIRVVESNRWR